jgi:hypothetical protein
MKKKLVSALLSFGLALSLLAGCGSSSSNQQENETLIESESTIESEEASTIEESSLVDETIEESSIVESEESSIEEETSTKASNETSKETTTNETTSDIVASSNNTTSTNDLTNEVASNTTINETPIVETPIESVVETPQETTSSTTTTSSLYSVDEYISIIKSELIKNGIQWYPDSDEYKECRALYPDIYIGPDGGMGWAIIDVDMSNPYYVSQQLLDGFKFDRLDYFYIEVLSSSNGNIQFKLYRG